MFAVLLFTAFVSAAAVCLFPYWWRWRVLKKIPHIPSSDGCFGSLDLVADLDHIPQNLGREADRLGGIMSFRVLHISIVILSAPDVIEQALPLPKDDAIYATFSGLTSPDGRTPNILSYLTNDGYWHKVRKGVAPAFNPRNLRAHFPHLLTVVDQLCGVLERAHAHSPHGTVDIDNVLQRESLDVIGRMGFGTDFGATRLGFEGEDTKGVPTSSPDSKSHTYSENRQTSIVLKDTFTLFRAAALEITKRWNSAFRYALRHIVPSARRGTRDCLAVQARMRQLLEEIRFKYDGKPPPESDTSIAAYLLRMQDLTDEQLVGEFALFFFAGFETTGHTLAWTLYLLARHPGALAEVLTQLEELELLLTPSRPVPRKLDYADVSRLLQGALGRCVNESMRLLSVVAGGTARRTAAPMKLREYDIPAGTALYLVFSGLHLGERNWERAHEFWPDRWKAPGAMYWHGEPSTAFAAASAEATKTSRGVDAWNEDMQSADASSMEALFTGASDDQGNPITRGGTTTNATTTTRNSEEDDQAAMQHLPRRFLPFSGGSRSCIGQELAKLNIAATLGVLLSRFEFRLPPELDSDAAQWELQINRITNAPDFRGRGLPMRVVPRAVQ